MLPQLASAGLTEGQALAAGYDCDCRVLGAQDIPRALANRDTRGALKIVAGSGWREGVVGTAVIPDNAASHSGFALISDGPVVSHDYATEDRFRASPIVLEHGARSGVTTPIVGPDGPWGVLGVHSLAPGRFDSDQIALLDTFANVLGAAISRRFSSGLRKK